MYFAGRSATRTALTIGKRIYYIYIHIYIYIYTYIYVYIYVYINIIRPPPYLFRREERDAHSFDDLKDEDIDKTEL